MQRLNLRSGLCLLSLSAAVLMSACKTEPPPTPPEPAPAPAPAPQPEAPKRVYADPPAPTAAKPVQFPEIQSFMLENNNLPVYVVENHEVPLVSAQLVINAGSMDDEFLAEMTAEMLGEGTKKRSKAKIDTTIEQVGASISTGAGIHNTTLSTRVLKRDLKL
ncbi:MAG: insulinase family protein, partial [Nannocystaceae bacterium]